MNTRRTQNQSASSSSDSVSVSPRKARKSTGAHRIVPDNNVSTSVEKKRNISKSPIKSTSSQSSSGEVLTEANLDNLVNKCVCYILVADQKKYAIKKQDILKHVFVNQDSRFYKVVLDKACNILKKTFGFEILDIKNRKNEYLLVNIMDRELGTRDFAEYSPLELQKQGLVFYLLTLIYMNENVISEDDLWKALEPLGININSRVPQPIFGDVKKYITVELVKQMYLEYRCVSKDPPQYEFVWGERAVQEVGKEQLLEFACKVMGDTKPQDWIYQYNDAKASANLEGD